MSIDFGRIIPTTQKGPMSIELIAHWKELLVSYGDDLIGENPSVILDSRSAISLEDHLQPMWSEQSKSFVFSIYHFELKTENGICLTASTFEESYHETEDDFVTSFGYNSDLEILKNLWVKFSEVRYWYSLTSYPSHRTIYELRLMKTLAASLANLCDGYIYLTEGGA